MIEVQFGPRIKRCALAGPGVCKVCGEEIVWAVTPNDKFIPLEPEEIDGVWEPHFGHCQGEAGPSTKPAPRPATGIEMPMTVWKGLLRFVHPDKHHGTTDEKLANDLTSWLLEQKPKLSNRRS